MLSAKWIERRERMPAVADRRVRSASCARPGITGVAATRLMVAPRDGVREGCRASLSRIARVMGNGMIFTAVGRTSCGFADFMVLMGFVNSLED